MIEVLLFYALVAATAVLATLTFLPVWRNEAWWVRVQDFPRLQIWILSMALIGLQLSLLDLSQAATHADYWFMRWPLDHLFHSGHFTLSRLARLPGFGSDHFPLLTELVFQGLGADQDNDLDADADDRARADSIADAENVSQNDVPQPG
jgi:endonuclease/exonuclease/phosphatase (EEP) superfamily protein YafD